MITEVVNHRSSSGISPSVVIDQSESKGGGVSGAIGRIAMQIIVPFAVAYLSYLLLPTSALAIVLPIVTIGTAFVVFFLCINQGIFPIAQQEAPMPLAAPRGIHNAGMNCWVNALAQTIRCDEALKEWFEHLPNEWARIQQIPFLAPEIYSRISSNDLAMPVALNDIFGNNEAPEQYLRQVHPKLQACIDEQNPDTIATARSHYRKYCAPFEGNDQEFMQFLLDPQFIANLYPQDRQNIQAYFQRTAEVPEARRYFHFFAEIPPDERLARWNGLAEFHLFLQAYGQAQEANLRQVDFQSQCLRIALHHLNPLISANPRVQLDPMEALTVIGDLLTPNHLKVAVEMRNVYALGNNPPIQGGESIVRREPFQQLGYIQLSLVGEHPNIQDMLAQAVEKENEDLNFLVQQKGVDGIVHEYLVEREQQQFVQAPSSLWLHVKRMEQVTYSSWECLQCLLPFWFPSIVIRFQKLKTPVEAQEEISIRTVDAGQANYQLDSFIVHRGSSLDSGHYVSYQLVEIEPENKVWFEMNDSKVRRLTEEEALNFREQAYVYHYSKVNF